jgi:hypothetical protein
VQNWTTDLYDHILRNSLGKRIYMLHPQDFKHDYIYMKCGMIMKQPRLEHHTARMWISVLLGIVYDGIFLYVYTLTGSTTLDGIIGVLLGLYIGAHPAAHLLDLLYLQRKTRHELLSSEAGISWLVVNILVVLVGIITIIIGANRFVQPTT